MNHKLTIIFTDGTMDSAVYLSKEIAETHEDGIFIALGNQVQYAYITPTTDDVTVFPENYTETDKKLINTTMGELFRDVSALNKELEKLECWTAKYSRGILTDSEYHDLMQRKTKVYARLKEVKALIRRKAELEKEFA